MLPQRPESRRVSLDDIAEEKVSVVGNQLLARKVVYDKEGKEMIVSQSLLDKDKVQALIDRVTAQITILTEKKLKLENYLKQLG